MTEQVARERVVGHGHDAFEAVRARVAELSGVPHPGLDVPSRVTMLPGDAVAVVERGHDAPTLQMAVDARGSLKAGECVWAGMAVAEALAALHRAGLAHGAISADAVCLPSGGVLLGRLVDGQERSTAPDDVAALGVLLASCVSGPEAERVRAWTEPMTHPDPGSRPTAAMVARALGSCASPEPMLLGPRGVAASMRASAALPGNVRKLPEARIWRWRLAARRWSVRAAAAVVVMLVVAGVLVGSSSLTGASDSPARGLAVVPTNQDPASVAQQATRARFEALRRSDGELLLRWTADGSPARVEAQGTADALATGRMVVDGLTDTIDQVDLGAAPSVASGVVVVRVTYSLSDHSVTLDGETTRFGGYSQTVNLELVRATTGWLVSSAVDVGTAGAQ
jgi:hypothetical protein